MFERSVFDGTCCVERVAFECARFELVAFELSAFGYYYFFLRHIDTLMEISLGSHSSL